MENRIVKMPMYRLNPDVIDRDQVSFGNKVQERLEAFAGQYFGQTYLKVGYNTVEMNIFGKNLSDWTKEMHDVFCWEFNAILYSFETVERISNKEQDFDVVYRYIPRFVRQKDNEELALDYVTIQQHLR